MEAIAGPNWTRWDKVVSEPKFYQYWFEKVDINFWYDFAENYMFIIQAVVVSCYLFGVWALSNFMRSREAYNLRVPLFCWNLFVGLLSMLFFYRISLEVIVLLRMENGFYTSLCLREGLHMSTAFWAVVIIWSKAIFVVDTTFLVLRKKTVEPLHLIHHVTAMILMPIVAVMSEPILRWMGLSNAFVHAVDYPILALTSFKIYIPKARQVMAALEFLQMLFILSLSAYTVYLNKIGTFCLRHPTSEMLMNIGSLGLLLVLIVTVLNPGYWKKGMKRIKSDIPVTNVKKSE